MLRPRAQAEVDQEAERARRSNESLNESMGELDLMKSQIQAHRLTLDPTIDNVQQRHDACERETDCTMRLKQLQQTIRD